MIQITSKCPAYHPCLLIRMHPSGAIKQATPYSLPVIDKNLCTCCSVSTTRSSDGAVKELVGA